MPLKQTRRIVVRAKGERAEEIFELRIGETRVGDPVTTTLDYDEYVFEADPSLTGPVSVVFTNDYYDGYAIDRNLWVDHLRISRQQYRGKVFEAVEVDNPAASAEASTTAREVVYSEGAWRTYRIPVNHLNGGKLVVGFMNDMDDNVHDFNLEVDWVRRTGGSALDC